MRKFVPKKVFHVVQTVRSQVSKARATRSTHTLKGTARREMARSTRYLRTGLSHVREKRPCMKIENDNVLCLWDVFIERPPFFRPDAFQRRVCIVYCPGISLSVICSNGGHTVFSYTVTKPDRRLDKANVRLVTEAVDCTEHFQDIETRIHPREWKILVSLWYAALEKAKLLRYERFQRESDKRDAAA